MADPFCNLKTLPVDGLPEVFPTVAADVRNVAIGVAERKMERRATRRQFLNQLAVENAARALDRLPEDGESFHGIMAGNFHAFAFLPAIIRLAGCQAAEVNVATLGFNETNTLELFDLLDKGRRAAVLFHLFLLLPIGRAGSDGRLGLRLAGPRPAGGRGEESREDHLGRNG